MARSGRSTFVPGDHMLSARQPFILYKAAQRYGEGPRLELSFGHAERGFLARTTSTLVGKRSQPGL